MSERAYPAEMDLKDSDRVLLVALADDALRGRRRARAEARVSELPDGARLLERQRRVRRALRLVGPVPEARSNATPVFAPAPRPRIARRPLRVAVAGAVGALLLALGLANLPGGGSLTTEAAELATAPATAPAPPSAGPVLRESVEGVPFPNWGPEFGWHPTGSRRDTLDGRATKTVFYEHMGHRIAYTILPGRPVSPPSDARIVRRGGLEIALVHEAGRDIAVFERGGRTCVLAGHVLHASTLVKLAAWTSA